MKKMAKIIALLHISIICCAILNLKSAYLISNNTCDISSQSSSGNNPAFLVSGMLFFPVTNGQEMNSGINKLPSVVRSSHPFDFIVSARAIKFFFQNTYSRYIYHTGLSEITCLKPPDIIFPFNYFW